MRNEDLIFLGIVAGGFSIFVALCVWSVVILKTITLGLTRWLQRPRAPYVPKPDHRQIAADKETKRRQREALAGLEEVYSANALEIVARFSRQAFDDYCRRHLLESLPAAEYETQCRRLERIILTHLVKTEPEPVTDVRDAVERQAAIREVHACYEPHAELLRDEYPPVRLRAALRVAITDEMTAAEAWRAAQVLIENLHTIVQGARGRRRTEQPANPASVRVQQLRLEIAQFDRQIDGLNEELARSRAANHNTTLEERTLGSLRQQRRSLTDELNHLLRDHPETNT